MGYFDTEEGVTEYIHLAEGYDGKELIHMFRPHLHPGAKILELGMGPGKDMEILQRDYQVTGSDSSEIFVNRYLKLHPNADLLTLDAISIDTRRRFDAIYSNKVLQHLTKKELATSIDSQHRVLNNGGIALHSIWLGDTCEEFGGLISQQHTLESFTKLLGGRFTVTESRIYTEMEELDSICIILKRVD